MLVIGFDDALDEIVADDVALVEMDAARYHRFSTIWMTSMRPERGGSGKSIWVASPVMIIFDPVPRRVEEHVHLLLVVFWASSRMTKESLRVRPRMKARGDYCDDTFSRKF